MNYNVIAYGLYIFFALYIIIRVGHLFHQRGAIFILQLFQQHTTLAHSTNNMLLVAYYLFNIGYALLRLQFWSPLHNWSQVITTLAHHLGTQIIVLAFVHYCNMLMIYLYARKKIIVH
jgi:hypothetical protein